MCARPVAHQPCSVDCKTAGTHVPGDVGILDALAHLTAQRYQWPTTPSRELRSALRDLLCCSTSRTAQRMVGSVVDHDVLLRLLLREC